MFYVMTVHEVDDHWRLTVEQNGDYGVNLEATDSDHATLAEALEAGKAWVIDHEG